jgi:hypothetical protein
LDYEVVFVTQTGGRTVPIELLAAQQPPTAPRPRTVTFDEPAHVSDYFIVPRQQSAIGIAIRRHEERDYCVQWFTPAEIDAAAALGVVTLKPIEKLPVLAAK